jgi:hypothetical protein
MSTISTPLVLSPIRSKRSCDYIQTSPNSPCSPTTRGKKSKYESDLTNLGYYSDPLKPNLFILSPGPGVLELRKDHQAPFKRHQSKVRAILPPRSQSLFTSPLSPSVLGPSRSLLSASSTAAPLFPQHSSVPLAFPSTSYHHPPSSSLANSHSIAQQQHIQQETDEEILSSLASIATSFDDEMDEIEAVFLHFSEE